MKRPLRRARSLRRASASGLVEAASQAIVARVVTRLTVAALEPCGISNAASTRRPLFDFPQKLLHVIEDH
ncbi:MAG: hypothetical protein L6Q76_20560, partial [Polyangiaceae bacterium]|nr:hypothetical protein [Polyangiaceae bacterium]